MHKLANQKRFIGLTMSGLATIASLGMLRNGVALGDKPSNDIFVYTGDQLTTFQNTALTESNNVRANRVNTSVIPNQPIPLLTFGEPQGATLDPTLTNGAQLWAEYLAKKNKGLEHSKESNKNRDKDAGENIFSYSTSVSPLIQPLAPDFLAKQAISFIGEDSYSFASEEANYNYATGESNGKGVIGHFTQLVWAATTNFSCGAAAATTADNDGFYNYYVVCQYYPAGNFKGQYLNNVFPKNP